MSEERTDPEEPRQDLPERPGAEGAGTPPGAPDTEPSADGGGQALNAPISEPEPPLGPPTEELFALEVKLRDEVDVPDLDPAVRAALLETELPGESAISAPPAADPGTAEVPVEQDVAPHETPSEQPTEPGGYVAPNSAEWELPTEGAIVAEQTAAMADQARNEVREAVEQARQTGRPWDPPRPPASGDFQPPGKRPRYWWRFLLATLIIVFAFGGATSASVLHVVNDIASKLSIPKKDRLPAWLVKDANGGPQTIAILGSDVRTGGGSAAGDPGRSDTTMLLRLDPDSGQIAMLSIPRDLKVEIPGYGTDKFNAAFSYGGTKLTLRTIKQLTGLEINHVITVDFQGFASLIDAVGCVFTDVDRKYYHSNEGLAPSEMWAEIDIEAGYQKLCGEKALDFARYRHTDSDLVRASRQQDLLSEVRNRLTFPEIIKRRDELMKAFTDNASSDIGGGNQILELIRLLFDSRDARVVEVKFPATPVMQNGISYVEAAPSEVSAAVDKFLGFKDSPGPIGTLKEGQAAPAKVRRKQEKRTRKRAIQATPPRTKKAPPKDKDGLVDASGSTMELARRLNSETRYFPIPVYYPKRLPEGTIFPEGSRVYFMRDPEKNHHRAYRMVMALQESDGQHYFGVQGIHGWTNPPILEGPNEVVKMGGRDFIVQSEGDRVRLVAWKQRGNTYWISNSLLLTLTNDQMLGMARSTRVFTEGK